MVKMLKSEKCELKVQAPCGCELVINANTFVYLGRCFVSTIFKCPFLNEVKLPYIERKEVYNQLEEQVLKEVYSREILPNYCLKCPKLKEKAG